MSSLVEKPFAAGPLAAIVLDGANHPVNLGNPVEFTTKKLAEEVIRLCGSRAGLEYLPLPHEDRKQRQLDTTQARELLSRMASIPLRDGLEKTVASFRKRATSDYSGAGSSTNESTDSHRPAWHGNGINSF